MASSSSSPSSANNNNSSTSTSDPPLCAKGCGFYGNPTTANMCSKCYKDFLNLTEERRKLQPLKLQPTTLPAAAALASSDHDHATSTSTSKKTKNRCDCCNKRVRLMGFECRCGGLFCGLHRYPEEHACNIDFKTVGRRQLEKQNPLCVADKLLERA